MVNLYYITVLLIYQRVNIIASINLTAIRYEHIKHSSSKSCSQCRIDVDFQAVKRLAFYTRLTVLYTMNSTIPDKREIQPEVLHIRPKRHFLNAEQQNRSRTFGVFAVHMMGLYTERN